MDDRQALKRRFATLGPASPPPLPGQSGTNVYAIDDILAAPGPVAVMAPGFDRVQLKVRRTQNKALLGGVGFSIHVIAELSPQARAAVKHYRLGDAILFQKDLTLKLSANIVMALWRFLILWLTRRRWRITVNDLVQGRTLSAKDVMHMLEIERDIRKAAARPSHAAPGGGGAGGARSHCGRERERRLRLVSRAGSQIGR